MVRGEVVNIIFIYIFVMESINKIIVYIIKKKFKNDFGYE